MCNFDDLIILIMHLTLGGIPHIVAKSLRISVTNQNQNPIYFGSSLNLGNRKMF